jgi:hypothetical protein
MSNNETKKKVQLEKKYKQTKIKKIETKFHIKNK